MTFEENDKKAFDFAADAAKQLITLATALIALTITFFKDFAGADSTGGIDLMPWSWGLLLVSLVLGLSHLYALTGALCGPAPHNIRSGIARISAAGQQLLFLAGIVVMVIAAINAL